MILQMPNKTGDGAQTIPNIPGSQAATLKESDEEEYARYMRPKSAEELGAKLNPSPAVLLAKYGTAPFCHRFTYYVSADGIFTVQQNAYFFMGWGGVGWDVNVHSHCHTDVMLRYCPFFCTFHTYVMLRWGGVGWGGMLTFIHTSTHT